MPSAPRKLTVGFATDDQRRELTPDDRLAAAELEKLGAAVTPVVWSESGDASPCDLLIIRSCWDYHLRSREFLRWVATVSAHTPVLNPPAMICWNIDKRYLEEVQDAGFPIPHTVVLEHGSAADLKASMLLHRFESAVVKPAISASAWETFLISSHHNAPALNARVSRLAEERVMLLQEFIPEIRTRGEWSFIFLGESFSHALRKVPRQGDYRSQREFGAVQSPQPPPAAALHLATGLVREFARQSLYCRVDLVESQRGWLVLELELIDPELYFAAHPPAALQFAELTLAAAEAAARKKQPHPGGTN